ncbi:cache domain-containing protein [Falsiroseomonas sp. HW251]|uniref:cache domain-containing protein n=1 Tax=Falsiroseomonas sp. HW251 TaxID=3390998 RepID=UPI003D31B7AA
MAAVALAVLLPALGFGVLATLRAADGQRAAAEERLRDTARALALAVEREIGRTTSALQAFATSPVFKAAPALADREAALAQAQALVGLVGNVSIAAPDGTVEVTTIEPLTTPQTLRLRSLDLVAHVVATGEPGVGNVVRGAVTARWIIPIIVPVRAEGGSAGLVIAGALNTEHVRQLLAAWDLDVANFAALTDARNVVVARSDAAHGQVV